MWAALLRRVAPSRVRQTASILGGVLVAGVTSQPSLSSPPAPSCPRPHALASVVGVAGADEGGESHEPRQWRLRHALGSLVRHYLRDRPDLHREQEARGDAPSAPWLRLPKRNVPEDVALPDVPEEAYKGVYELLRKDWLGENELSQRAQWLSHLQEPKVRQMVGEAEEVTQRGEQSLHPWYPSDRRRLDLFMSTWRAYYDRLLPRLLPPRIAPPYGKPLTVVLDARVLQSPEAANGRRPGLDRFLGMLMGKYENMHMVEDIDSGGQLCTYITAQELEYSAPEHYWKSVRVLNRPVESTVIVDTEPTHCYHNPDNCLIVRAWDGENVDDRALLVLADLLNFVASAHVLRQAPVTRIIPAFHGIASDAPTIWYEDVSGAKKS